MNGRALAPPCTACRTGVSTSRKPRCVQVLADGLEHGGPDPGHPPGVRIDDQVHVTVADPGLGIAEPLMLFRQRPQALGGDRVAVGEDGQLAAAGGDHLAFHPDVVAQVHVPLPGGQRVRADPVQGDHDLDVAGAVPDGGEAQLPAGPGQHHPAGDADPVPGVGVRLQIGVAGPDLGDGGGAREADRIGVHALVQQPLPLVQPDPHLLRHARRPHDRPPRHPLNPSCPPVRAYPAARDHAIAVAPADRHESV